MIPAMSLLDLNRSFKIGDQAEQRYAQRMAADLAAKGDMQGAAAIAMKGGAPEGMSLLSLDAQNRRATADQEWRQEEARRAQANADRSYGLQRETMAMQRDAQGKPVIVGAGDTLVDPKTRQPIYSAPAAPKPLTDGQANAGLYADRMTEAEPIIEKYKDAGTSLKDNAAAGIPLVGNYIVSKDFQKLDQAQRNFINATLRRESGAVISPQEFDNAKKQYFPQPGDDADVLEQKRLNRATAREGIARGAGPSYRPREGGPAAPHNDPVAAELRRRGLIP